MGLCLMHGAVPHEMKMFSSRSQCFCILCCAYQGGGPTATLGFTQCRASNAGRTDKTISIGKATIQQHGKGRQIPQHGAVEPAAAAQPHAGHRHRHHPAQSHGSHRSQRNPVLLLSPQVRARPNKPPCLRTFSTRCTTDPTHSSSSSSSSRRSRQW